jgi:hypothetical protein
MTDTGGPARERYGLFLTVLAMVGSILVQSAILFIWGAKLDQRVANLEQKVAGNDKLAETVARVDERTAALSATVNRIADTMTPDVRRRP